MHSLFPSPAWPALPVLGLDGTYPVHRIFCVGRNYAAHAAEMGDEADRETPFYFTKSALAFAPSGSRQPYPPGTSDYHHEVELAVAIGTPAFQVTPEQARGAVYGYGTALDMTRRDLQLAAKDKARPWSLAKDVEASAIIGTLTRAADFQPGDQTISLTVNGQPRQQGQLSDMIFNALELIADLSRFYHLAPGDVILTGTPAGVGPVVAGDVIEGRIEGLEPVRLTLI